ncbi:MAG: hypothetical protein ACREXG_02160 [Polaromonas sp.]
MEEKLPCFLGKPAWILGLSVLMGENKLTVQRSPQHPIRKVAEISRFGIFISQTLEKEVPHQSRLPNEAQPRRCGHFFFARRVSSREIKAPTNSPQASIHWTTGQERGKVSDANCFETSCVIFSL